MFVVFLLINLDRILYYYLCNNFPRYFLSFLGYYDFNVALIIKQSSKH